MTSSKEQSEKTQPGSFLRSSSQYHYTRGIDVQQVSLSGVGDCSIWEFSGHDNYYMLYDHFIGNSNCIHVVMFSLADSTSAQIAQVTFWLTFLQSRIPPVEPLGDSGRSHKPAHVMLVATHADTLRTRGAGTLEELNTTVQTRFGHVFTLEEKILMIDSHAAGSQEIKTLKNVLQQRKQQMIEVRSWLSPACKYS